MISRYLLVVVGTATLSACATIPDSDADQEIFSFEDRALDRVTSPVLEKFRSEAEFRRYIERLEKIKDERESEWVRARPERTQYASLQDLVEPCVKPEDCPEEDSANSVVVTGARIAAPPPSITNNQSAGVDEGDIVKQIGPYLLVLQDGRIFSIDTRDGLTLVDRQNVYTDSKGYAWYDEMLVQDNKVLITAYSYREDATEFSIFNLDRNTGKLTPDGVFLISSDDYYSSDNYATRIIGDKLVFYTPYRLEDLEDLDDRPVIRRWLPEEERDEAYEKGKALFDARDIYKPVQRTKEPTIHTISVCPIGKYKSGDDLKCRSTGFVGPENAVWFVSPEEVYLWISPGGDELEWHNERCKSDLRPDNKDVIPAAIFRLPISGKGAGVIGISGLPFDQFSMDSRDGNFRALHALAKFRCDDEDEDYDNNPYHLAYAGIPHRLFTEGFEQVGTRQVTVLPRINKKNIENRFAGDWLVYGGRDGWWSRPPEKEDGPQMTQVGLVPVKSPQSTKLIDLPHNIIRTEWVGKYAVLNGYRDDSGLNVSLLELSDSPRIASTLFMDRRYESESRSHAFNAAIEQDGSGVLGIPTVVREEDSSGYYWRSESSDISYLNMASNADLSSAGELKVSSPEPDARYSCEISCIDWYGNSRPIFTGGRIFGLMGTELVEAKITDGKLSEIGRVDLTVPVGMSPLPKKEGAEAEKPEPLPQPEQVRELADEGSADYEEIYFPEFIPRFVSR